MNFGVADYRYCWHAPFKRELMEYVMTKNDAKMTLKAAARIYSVTAKQGDGTVAKGDFGARAMRAAMGHKNPSEPRTGVKAARGIKS